MVVLVDEEDRENEGDLVLAAEFVTPEAINFMARHARGLICLTLTEERCRAARPAADGRAEPLGARAPTSPSSIEAARRRDHRHLGRRPRAHRARRRSPPDAKPADIVQPGHIFPLMAQPGGVLARAGHTEAGCDLARARRPHARGGDLRDHEGRRHDGAAARPDRVRARRTASRSARSPTSSTTAAAPSGWSSASPSGRSTTPHGAFRLVVYRDKLSDATHLALVRGPISPDTETLVRVHEPLSVMDLLDARQRVALVEHPGGAGGDRRRPAAA